MKLINNQESLLIEELKALLTENSEVLICASYFSVNSIFELSTYLEKVKSIRILVDSNLETDTMFAYDIKEWEMYYDLKSKHKTNTSLEIIKDKCSIRYGNVGGQKFIIVINGTKSHCFSIVPQDLNCLTLGL